MFEFLSETVPSIPHPIRDGGIGKGEQGLEFQRLLLALDSNVCLGVAAAQIRWSSEPRRHREQDEAYHHMRGNFGEQD